MEKVPSLFIFITAGMEGNTMHASRRSRSGLTTSTIYAPAASVWSVTSCHGGIASRADLTLF